MRRFRLVLALLVGGAILGLGAATVFAGSKHATYTNHAVSAWAYTANGDHAAKPGQVGTWEWLTYGQSATWRFDATQLSAAVNKSVTLNIAALSTGAQLGSGYSTNLRVAIFGAGTARYTVTLVNPWKPHIASNATPGIGWQAYASVNVPKYVYAGAYGLRITVMPTTPGNFVGLNQGAILIGYCATP
jgi:hypothetical protein